MNGPLAPPDEGLSYVAADDLGSSRLNFAATARVGRLGKPECYYFPPQMNNHMGRFPSTYFGFDPDTTKEQAARYFREREEMLLSE